MSNSILKYWLSFFLAFSFVPCTIYADTKSDKDCNKILVENNQADIKKSPAKFSLAVETYLQKTGLSKREAKGYAILISTMVLSAAGTTYVTSTLPQELQFLTQFLAQVSTIGVYVLGAPIWEPLSSKFRKLAFGLRGPEKNSSVRSDPGLENLWRASQENYSINSQMSRNVINQFILSVQQNFYQAYQAVHSKNPEYAADQIGQAAYRLRILFKEIPPEAPSVRAVVRASFANHVRIDQSFIDLVNVKIKEMDPSYAEKDVNDYYVRILQSWLGQN